jgi:hypothetical protein
MKEFVAEVLESLRPVFTAHEYDLHEAIGLGGFSVVSRVHSSPSVRQPVWQISI